MPLWLSALLGELRNGNPIVPPPKGCWHLLLHHHRIVTADGGGPARATTARNIFKGQQPGPLPPPRSQTCWCHPHSIPYRQEQQALKPDRSSLFSVSLRGLQHCQVFFFSFFFLPVDLKCFLVLFCFGLVLVWFLRGKEKVYKDIWRDCG